MDATPIIPSALGSRHPVLQAGRPWQKPPCQPPPPPTHSGMQRPRGQGQMQTEVPGRLKIDPTGPQENLQPGGLQRPFLKGPPECLRSLFCAHKCHPIAARPLKLNKKRESVCLGRWALGCLPGLSGCPDFNTNRVKGQGNSSGKGLEVGEGNDLSCEAAEFSCSGLSGTRLSRGPTQPGSSGGWAQTVPVASGARPEALPVWLPEARTAKEPGPTVSFLTIGKGVLSTVTGLGKHTSERGDDASPPQIPRDTWRILVLKCTC